ncbi:MAG: hypothetical protein QOJ85_826 [Solirubrobacteraceae bacterium]|nr:hypothetical protein [Solirubrobacteraceae bacterium]
MSGRPHVVVATLPALLAAEVATRQSLPMSTIIISTMNDLPGYDVNCRWSHLVHDE